MSAEAAIAPWNRRTAASLGACAVLTMLPVTVVVPVLKELVTDRFAAGAFWTHSFMSINLIGAVVAVPVIAALADRLSRRNVIVVALALDGLMFLAMALAPNLFILLLLRLFEGACHILTLSSLMALAADRAPLSQRGRTMGILGSCMMLGTAAGTRLGGVIWRGFPDAVFEWAAVIALVGAGAALALLPATAGRRSQRGPGIVGALRGRPQLAVPYAFTFVDRFCVGVIISSFVLFLATAHDLDPDARSPLLVLFLVPFALLIYPVGRLIDRFGSVGPLVGGSIGFGCLFGAYGFVPLGWLPVVMVVSGVLSALMFAPTLTLCADLSSSAQRGAAYAGFNAAGSLGFIAGPLVAGSVCHALDTRLGEIVAYRLAFLMAGVFEVLCAALALRWLLLLARRGEIRVGRRAERRSPVAACSESAGVQPDQGAW